MTLAEKFKKYRETHQCDAWIGAAKDIEAAFYAGAEVALELANAADTDFWNLPIGAINNEIEAFNKSKL